jgi:hypothetical protein
MPTSSNHTEVSVYCCHGYTVASSRTLLSDLLLISRSLHSNGSTRYNMFLRNVSWLSPDCTALYPLDLVFGLENGGDVFPWNISWLSPDFTVLCPRDFLFGLEDGGDIFHWHIFCLSPDYVALYLPDDGGWYVPSKRRLALPEYTALYPRR